jgi:hypothetical protein
VTPAEFVEFLVQETKRLELQTSSYQCVFDEIIRVHDAFPEHRATLEVLGLTPTALNGALVAARAVVFSDDSLHARYDAVLEMLRPRGAASPDLKGLEKYLSNMKLADLH